MTVELAEGAEVGGYRVRRVLGRGGMGVVYEALQHSLNRPVALKVLPALPVDADARERFRREAEAQAGLTHPHVVAVYEAGEAPEGLYIAMQLISGGTLREAIGEGMEPERVLRLLAPVAEALDAAHAAGLVHRDVKPHNILIDGDDRALLADFGLVRALTGSSLTQSGGFLGTPDYVAPEQVRGDAPSPASDVYAFAAVLYQCLTGSVVFPVSTVDAALYAHAHEAPLPASARRAGLPAALDEALYRGLAKDPASRPATARALVDEAAAGMRVGSPARTAAAGAARRLVSVLCAELAGGGDPEARHAVLAAWSTRAAEVAERHGGVAAPAAGVDFMAVFGLDRLHEDDALRALRAADELRGPGTRIGVDAGLVFAERTLSGEPVRSAFALAGAAGDGEVLLGDGAHRLVGEQVDTEPAVSAGAWRLCGLTPSGAGPRSPFVGRERELDALRAIVDDAIRAGECRLVTVLGPAGIGKSRLARELVDGLSGTATTLVGRCAPYGEGLTYRPLVEMLAQLPRDLGAPDGTDELRILTAAGELTGSARPEETAWSVRRLLERLAADRPVVAVFEDIHWAQPLLLDLLDHVAALSSGAPLVLVCLARPDLLDTRPAWATPHPKRALVTLEPLAAADAERLVAAGAADANRVAAIVETAEGNPLFLEQLLTVEGGELPPTVHAVLAARIDALAAGEREILEHASVLGRSFPVAALGARPPITELAGLARRQLLVPDRLRGAGEDAFRFSHALIRDAAYAGIARRRRAELHEQAADWLERRPEQPDRAALAGHHLEAAYRHRAELGDDDRDLARRAGAHLQEAAEIVRRRGDSAAAITLLERALALAGGEDAVVMQRLGSALVDAGHFEEARVRLQAALARGEADGDAALAARARVELGFLQLHVDVEADVDSAVPIGMAALKVLEEHDDVVGQSRAHQLIAMARWTQGRHAVADRELRRAADLAQAAGDERMWLEVLAWSAGGAGYGPEPVPAAIARCEQIRAQVAASPFTVALVDGPLALLYALAGDFERSRERSASVTATLADIDSIFGSVAHQQALAFAVTGDLVGAEHRLREDRASLEAMGEHALRSTTAAFLARVVLEQGRDDEAELLVDEARRLGAADDEATQSLWRVVQGQILARRGRADEGEVLAREAIAMVEPTDSLVEQAYAYEALADILTAAGRTDDARKALEAAVDLYDRKGATVPADRARHRLSAS